MTAVLYSVYFSLAVWFIFLRRVWPWDWKGNRKAIVIKRKRRDWEGK